MSIYGNGISPQPARRKAVKGWHQGEGGLSAPKHLPAATPPASTKRTVFVTMRKVGDTFAFAAPTVPAYSGATDMGLAFARLPAAIRKAVGPGKQVKVLGVLIAIEPAE